MDPSVPGRPLEGILVMLVDSSVPEEHFLVFLVDFGVSGGSKGPWCNLVSLVIPRVPDVPLCAGGSNVPGGHKCPWWIPVAQVHPRIITTGFRWGTPVSPDDPSVLGIPQFY